VLFILVISNQNFNQNKFQSKNASLSVIKFFTKKIKHQSMKTRSSSTRPLCVHSQVEPDPDWYRKTLNQNDPITMEPVHLARSVFLQKCPKRNRHHAYDADALAQYIETSATPTSPLTREPFSNAELRVISRKANHPADYLLAVIQFNPWKLMLPSTTTIESSPVDALATYFEMIVQMADKKVGPRPDMVHLVLMPKIQNTLNTIHHSPHLPAVPAVLRSLKSILKQVPERDMKCVYEMLNEFQSRRK